MVMCEEMSIACAHAHTHICTRTHTHSHTPAIQHLGDLSTIIDHLSSCYLSLLPCPIPVLVPLCMRGPGSSHCAHRSSCARPRRPPSPPPSPPAALSLCWFWASPRETTWNFTIAAAFGFRFVRGACGGDGGVAILNHKRILTQNSDNTHTISAHSQIVHKVSLA